jgi:hypothetical protein
MQLLGTTNKKYILAQTSAGRQEQRNTIFTKTKFLRNFVRKLKHLNFGFLHRYNAQTHETAQT